jgi:hypothetical protein
MITIEQQIDKFYEETEESVRLIIEGSDEHLDMILSITKPLEILSQKFEKLNDFLYNNINNYSDEQIGNLVMPKLKLLKKSCMTLVGAIRTSFLYRDVRVALKNYTRQHDILREIIHDVHNFRLAKDDEFDNILKELNDI